MVVYPICTHGILNEFNGPFREIPIIGNCCCDVVSGLVLVHSTIILHISDQMNIFMKFKNIDLRISGQSVAFMKKDWS